MIEQKKNSTLLSRLYNVLFRHGLKDSTDQTKQEYVATIKRGVDSWNQWREQHPDIQPDLSNINLTGIRLGEANLSRTNLQNSLLPQTDLNNTNLNEANL